MRREDDKVTKFIRQKYNPFVQNKMFLYNIVFSRFINWPPTLEIVGFMYEHEPERLRHRLKTLSELGKIWGNAYIITTHGQRMSKIDYLVDQVLTDVAELDLHEVDGHHGCAVAHDCLMYVDGIGSFLAAQIVADLKNTPHHWLYKAGDKMTFVAHGPGSIRGASWFFYGHTTGVTAATFEDHFHKIRNYVDAHWPDDQFPICNQDLQNCLCEYDKYMRVLTGTGRSKRGYDGS